MLLSSMLCGRRQRRRGSVGREGGAGNEGSGVVLGLGSCFWSFVVACILNSTQSTVCEFFSELESSSSGGSVCKAAH